MLSSEASPGPIDRLEMRAWYTQAVTDRLPTAAFGLVSMHLVLLVVFVAYAPTSTDEATWRDALVLAHTVQACVSAAIGGWAHFAQGRRPAHALAVLQLLGVSYLIFGAVVAAIDQLRDLSLVAYATACIGVALVLEVSPGASAMMFAAAAAVCVWGVGLTQDESTARVAAQVNSVGIAAMSFGAAMLLSQWRLYGWWRQRVAERAAHDLIGLNARLADEIARRRTIESELAALANRDSLTELDNRRGFLARLDVGHLGASGAVLLLDVDHFKALNDALGHPAGDAALRAIGRVLREGVRSDDAVGRLGGDEFGVLLPGASLPEAEALAESLRRAVAEARIGPAGHAVTVSVGVGVRQPGEPYERCFARVDAALYRAKAAGRNCVAT